VPAAWLGATLIARGHRARGAMGWALRRLAAAVREVAPVSYRSTITSKPP
jgi:hypothetical protein